MPAQLEGMRRDFPEVGTPELGPEGERGRLKGSECGKQGNANCWLRLSQALRADRSQGRKLEEWPRRLILPH